MLLKSRYEKYATRPPNRTSWIHQTLSL